MKRVLGLVAIMLMVGSSSLFADIQLQSNNSFEEMYNADLFIDWASYNYNETGTYVGPSTTWKTEGLQSAHMQLFPSADPVWCGVGKGVAISFSDDSQRLTKLYVCANVNVVSLENAHVKLEVKHGADAFRKELKVLEPGRHTLSMVIDATELPYYSSLTSKYYYSFSIAVILGSEFHTASADASGEAYVDEVYTLATTTRIPNTTLTASATRTLSLTSSEATTDSEVSVTYFEPNINDIGYEYLSDQEKIKFSKQKKVKE